MILAIDVDYREESKANVAGVLFLNWEDATPFKQLTVEVEGVLPYESGSFYKRELPCILALLKKLEEMPSLIIVDGYVTLAEGKKGLGAYLYEALEERVPVVGVAKNLFPNIPESTYLFRGESKKPLYITSLGISENIAKECIGKMHGKYRFPTLLKEVDRLCREVIN